MAGGGGTCDDVGVDVWTGMVEGCFLGAGLDLGLTRLAGELTALAEVGLAVKESDVLGMLYEVRVQVQLGKPTKIYRKGSDSLGKQCFGGEEGFRWRG